MNSKKLFLVLSLTPIIYTIHAMEKEPVALEKPAKLSTIKKDFNPVEDYTTIDNFLNSEGNITDYAHDGVPLIARAARSGNVPAIGLLVALGANVNAPDVNGWRPVHYATLFGHLEALISLQEHGADISAEDNEGVRPIHRAAQMGDTAILDWFSGHGADISASDHHGWQPIHYAAYENQPKALEWLQSHGADIHPQDQDGFQPIDIAARYNELESFTWLIEHGASIPTEYPMLRDALTQERFSPRFSLSVSLGKHVLSPSKLNIFLMVAGQGNGELLKDLINTYPTNELPPPVYAQALLAATIAGHLEIVQILREYVGYATMSRAMMIAIRRGDIDLFNYFLSENTPVKATVEELELLFRQADAEGHSYVGSLPSRLTVRHHYRTYMIRTGQLESSQLKRKLYPLVLTLARYAQRDENNSKNESSGLDELRASDSLLSIKLERLKQRCGTKNNKDEMSGNPPEHICEESGSEGSSSTELSQSTSCAHSLSGATLGDGPNNTKHNSKPDCSLM